MHSLPAKLLSPALITVLLLSSQAFSASHRQAVPVREHQKPYSFLPDRKPATALLPHAKSAVFIRQPANLPVTEGSATRTEEIKTTPEIRVSPAFSWIDAFSPEQVAQLAALVAKQIETRLSLPQAILLTQPPATPSAKAFHATLTDKLRKQGFTLVTHPTDEATPVRYRISRTDFNVLLRLRIRNTEITRLYEHSAFGHYIAVSPICIIDEGEE